MKIETELGSIELDTKSLIIGTALAIAIFQPDIRKEILSAVGDFTRNIQISPQDKKSGEGGQDPCQEQS